MLEFPLWDMPTNININKQGNWPRAKEMLDNVKCERTILISGVLSQFDTPVTKEETLAISYFIHERVKCVAWLLIIVKGR